MSIRTRLDALNNQIDSRTAVLGRWITVEASGALDDRIERSAGGLTLRVPLAFRADPEAGLDAEQRALIGLHDRLIVVRCMLPTTPSDIDEE